VGKKCASCAHDRACARQLVKGNQVTPSPAKTWLLALSDDSIRICEAAKTPCALHVATHCDQTTYKAHLRPGTCFSEVVASKVLKHSCSNDRRCGHFKPLEKTRGQKRKGIYLRAGEQRSGLAGICVKRQTSPPTKKIAPKKSPAKRKITGRD